MRAEEPFSLGPRLGLCASFVRPGCRLADIGADHAHLSVWLACRGAVRSAIAADVREGPLSAARRTIARCGVESLVSARLSDGLRAIRPEEADDIVIAGMGGELIARIVGEAPWLRTPDRHLILQPMASAEDLRRFLPRAGFAVSREEAVREDDRVYSALLNAFRAADEEDLPLYAGYLASYGDERALPALIDAIAREDIGFVAYRELKFAIEALGGSYDEERDFSQDAAFQKVKAAGAETDIFQTKK